MAEGCHLLVERDTEQQNLKSCRATELSQIETWEQPAHHIPGQIELFTVQSHRWRHANQQQSVAVQFTHAKLVASPRWLAKLYVLYVLYVFIYCIYYVWDL